MRDHEDEPAQVVLDRLRNNPPIPPSTAPGQAPDLDYPRRKEAWDRAVEREEERARIEQGDEGDKKKATAPGTGWRRPFLFGTKAGGPEVPSAEEQEKTRKAQEQQAIAKKRADKNRKKTARRKKR